MTRETPPVPPAAPGRAPRRWLDPIDRFSEALFGIIMVLTFTSSLSAAQGGREEMREILLGAVSCNLAWGIVDAVMYLLAQSSERGRQVRALRRIREAADPQESRRLFEDALPDLVRDVLRPEEVEDLRRRVAASAHDPAERRLSAADFAGAGAVFLLVVLSAVPLILPFVLMDEPRTAIRVSNGIAMALLFLGGWNLARVSGGRPLRAGLTMVAVGLALVAVTVALGG